MDRIYSLRACSVALAMASVVWLAGCAGTPDEAEAAAAPVVEGAAAPASTETVEVQAPAPAEAPATTRSEAVIEALNAEAGGNAPEARPTAVESESTLDLSLPGAPREDIKLASPVEVIAVDGGLSLGEALAIVWRENPQVSQAELALRATGYEVSGNYVGYFPYLQLQTAQGENDNISTVRVIQPLWNGGLTGAQVDQAKARQLIALADLNKIRLDLGMRVAETYLNVALAQEQALQWDGYLASLRKLLVVIERRAEQGASPQADQQTAISRLRQAEAGREATQSILAANQAQLSSLLNRSPGLAIWPVDGSGLGEDDIARIGTDFAEAHPDRQLAMSQIKLQEATARISKASLWPELSAQYRTQFEGTVIDPNDDDSALLVLTYQSNSGLKGYRAYQAEKERVQSAEARLKAAIRELESRIRVLRAQRKAAQAQWAVQSQASEAADLLIESFERQFLVGRKTWLELLNTYREANDSRLQSIAIKRAFWLADVQLALQGLYWRRLTEDAPPVEVAIEKK